MYRMTVDINIDKHGVVLLCHGDFTASVPFYHTLTYLRPSCYTVGKYRLHASSWWIVCDSAYTTPCEVRCTNDTGEMILSYHNGGTTLCVPISYKEATELLYALEKSLLALSKLCSVKKDPVRIFIPTGMYTQFRVNPLEFMIPYGFEPALKHVLTGINPVMRSSYSKARAPAQPT